MEKPVSNVLDTLPAQYRSLVIEVIGEEDRALLVSLGTHDEPNREERLAVLDILSSEFSRNLLPDDEPTQRRRDIDDALGAFLLRWPVEFEYPVDTLPAQFRSLFIEVIGAKDADLLASLSSQGEPSQGERRAVEEILSTEFSRNLRTDYEPTERGRDIDNMLGALLLRWPIESE
jgi:hypothetical protein